MKIYRFLFHLTWIALTATLFVHCATPTQPSGGEPDRTGPEIAQTQPEDGTVNFDGTTIVFEFEDWVDRGSFEQAFSIQPELNIDYEISWSRRTATVELLSGLPDTTTVVFNLSTDLTDMNNNEIQSSFNLAVSTGPEIDEGRLTGYIIDGKEGAGMQNARVLLYRQPHDLDRTADYIAQADEDGKIVFDYLREGKYKAFWVDDRNRNRRWDPPQESAQPFPKEFVELEASGEQDLGAIHVMQVDSIPPELIGVGLYNTNRMRLRFSENIEISDTSEVNVTDIEGDHLHDALPLYVEPQNPNILFARSDEPLNPEEEFLLDLKNIFDDDGNEAVYATDPFSGSDEADTTLQRLVRHDTEFGIRETEPLRFRYADIIEDDMIRDSLEVIVTDTTITGWEHSEVRDNLLYIYPDEQWDDAENYTFRVWNPGRMERRDINPTIWYEDDFGEIEVVVEEPASEDAIHHYDLYNEEGRRIRTGNFHENEVLDELPPGNYRLIVFEDQNRDGRWNPGTVDPFEAPEPFFVQGEVPVESGFTGQVYVEFGTPPDELQDPAEDPGEEEIPEDMEEL